MFILVGVVLMGVEGWVGLGVLYGFYFRVFRIYTAPLVCILGITGLCSSLAEIWF